MVCFDYCVYGYFCSIHIVTVYSIMRPQGRKKLNAEADFFDVKDPDHIHMRHINDVIGQSDI